MFDNCEIVLDKIVIFNFKIVLMDIDLFGMDGIEGIRWIKNLLFKLEIIIIIVFENSKWVFDVLCVGVIGYLIKNLNYIELLDVLDEIIKGGFFMSVNIVWMVIIFFYKFNMLFFLEKEKIVL